MLKRKFYIEAIDTTRFFHAGIVESGREAICKMVFLGWRDTGCPFRCGSVLVGRR